MKQSQSKKQVALGLAVLIAIFAVFYWLVTSLWSWFSELNSDLAVGMLTASSTVIVATVTLVLGRYLERVKEAESHLRSQKIEMYDEFLKQLFSLFHQERSQDSEDLVSFLQEWQRKLVVWGGPNVLKAFIQWKEYMSYKEPDAQTVFLMDAFFRAMRRDIGLSNKNLDKGCFSHLLLRHASLFLAEAKKNPNVTLKEVAELEKKLGL
ncbi:hypothetical protein [Vreelandella titanicae]|uniref:hypothetical protein n=1 Tax=Vreelandella titanicae TaxID=664683 RepID=UPI0011413378|nr:hypothetical protein [Halomonas titanicae]